MAKTLLIDLDGTLVDSVPDLAAAVNKLLLEQNRPALRLEEVQTMVGDGAAKLVERALTVRGIAYGPQFLEQAITRFLALYEADIVVETRTFPGAIEALERVKAAGWRLAVCTNKPEHPSRMILEGLGLMPLFDGLAGGDSFPVKKPDPGHLLMLLDRLGSLPEETTLLGDGHQDLAAARAAGVSEIWAAFGYGGDKAKALAPAVTLHDFRDLPALLGVAG